MGKFHDLLDHLGDNHIIAKTRVVLLLSELALEIGNTRDEDLRKLLITWLD